MINLNKFIGIPFVDGGRELSGCDCWGLVMLVFKEFGIELPDYKIACEDKSRIDEEINNNRIYWDVVDRSNPTVPSLVVMRFNSVTLINHTGIYIGNNQFIHTAKRINSHVASIDSPAWNKRIEGFYVPKKG